MTPERFTLIGENVHTTRIVLRKGKRFATCGGVDGVTFVSEAGEPGLLPISETMQASQAYQEGRIKHIALAVEAAMGGGDDAGVGYEYLRRVVLDQERAGADYLDVNVDEISLKTAEQRQAMEWLVGYVRSLTALPISVDSSDISVIETGLAAAAGGKKRPMLNSASLERTEAVQLAVDYGARAIVTAAGGAGMPSDAAERVENASRMVETALAAGIDLGDIFVDPLVFPISVDSNFGLHTLDAIQTLRSRFGAQINITGGMSNVSFGIPARKLMNTAFINLAVEAGADSGIIDPVMNQLADVFTTDRETDAYRLAEDVLLGRDDFCMNYITAWRTGALSPLEGRA
ncbi:MAG: dihydropteroate synthase [bacterium]|nr:dihydropteroate synthase [Acidimicrobiia bacterium]MCY4649785.1 dihydropteroate synthase [bacterium]